MYRILFVKCIQNSGSQCTSRTLEEHLGQWTSHFWEVLWRHDHDWVVDTADQSGTQRLFKMRCWSNLYMGRIRGGFTPVLIQDNWVLWSSISHCMLWTRDRYFTVLKEQTDGTPEVETSRLRKVVGTPGHFVVMERLLLFNCPHPAADKSCQYERGSACLCTRPPQVIRQQYEVSQWHVQ